VSQKIELLQLKCQKIFDEIVAIQNSLKNEINENKDLIAFDAFVTLHGNTFHTA
jgi:hypothetical protein